MQLDWSTVNGGTGYRVERASSANGPFRTAADVNVVTGVTTAGEGVTNIWSDDATYFPKVNATSSSARPTTMHYVEILQNGQQREYFRVLAYNTSTTAPPSPITCGAVYGMPNC